MRKINIRKIDTSLAFGFYISDYEEFKYFKAFLQENHLVHKENWIFSHFETKPKFNHAHLDEKAYNFDHDDDEFLGNNQTKNIKKSTSIQQEK